MCAAIVAILTIVRYVRPDRQLCKMWLGIVTSRYVPVPTVANINP